MIITKLKVLALQLKKEIITIYLAYKDPRVSWYARIFIACVLAYAFSPIDLVPDFIPVLGYLDDLILIPLGISLAIKLIPEQVLLECRKKAAELSINKPQNWLAAFIIVIIWILLIAAVIFKYLS